MREGEGYSRRRVRSVQVTKGSNMGFICTAITEILPNPKFLDHSHTLQLFIVDESNVNLRSKIHLFIVYFHMQENCKLVA